MAKDVRDIPVFPRMEYDADPAAEAHLAAAEAARDNLQTTLTEKRRGLRFDAVGLGDALFRLAFPKPGDVDRLVDALVWVREGDRTLRLWVRPEGRRLSALPWEYLRLPDSAVEALKRRGGSDWPVSRFLALYPAVSLVRQATDDLPEGRVERTGPLRVFIAWANPAAGPWGDVGSDITEQVEGILNELRGLPSSHLEVRKLEHATAKKLREAMGGADWKPHVLHFIGHGGVPGMDRNIDDLEAPSLVLEGEPGAAVRHDYLTAPKLRQLCADCGTHVVVLNSCWGARDTRFAGFAQGLTAPGAVAPVAVAVAMQMEILTGAATGFACSLYKQLAVGRRVEEAVATYRRHCVAAHPWGDEGMPEWGIPAVFLGVRETALFRTERIDVYPLDFGPFIRRHAPIVGREFVREEFERFVASSPGGAFLLVARPGLGKTAFLAHWVDEAWSDTPPHFFFRTTEGRTDPDICVRSLYQALLGKHGILEAELAEPGGGKEPEGVYAARLKLERLLRLVSEECGRQNRKEILLIDALDEAGQTTDAKKFHEVLPAYLPPHVYLVATSRPGSSADAFAHTYGVKKPFEIEADSAENLADATTYCVRALERGLGNGPQDEVCRVAETLARNARGNFLVLRMFLDGWAAAEAPTLGEIDATAQRLTGSVKDAYAEFLRRVFDPLSLADREVLDRVLGGFATALGPVTRGQLRAAFGLMPTQLNWAFERVAQFLEWGGAADGDGGSLTYRLWHETFREYRLEALEEEKREVHGRWAEWCEKWKKLKGYERAYALRHLPTHLREGADAGDEKDPAWDRLAETLTDLEFIEAKCAAGMTYELLADYGAALKVLPEAQPERDEEGRRQQRLEKWTQDLIACARGDLLRENLEVIPSVEPWTEAQIQADIHRILTNPARLDRVRAFAQFVAAESHDLVKFAGRPGYVVQQAHNSARSSPVPSAAEALLPGTAAALLLVPAPWRPQPNPHPPLLQTLVGHTDTVDCVALTPDGRRAVSGSRDGTLRVWDLETGASRALVGHIGEVPSVALTPDGRRAVSGSGDHTLRVWDLETGASRVLVGHICAVTSIALTPDGRRAVSGSQTGTLRVWDLETGASRALEGHTGPVMNIALTPDGGRAVSGWGGNLRVWDLETGASRALEELPGWVTGVALTLDGRRAVLEGRFLWVRNLKTGAWRALVGHTDWVTSVALTPDGRRAASGSLDNTLRVWDLETGACVALVSVESPITAVSAAEPEKGLAFGTQSGQVFFAAAVGLPSGPGLTTAVRLWVSGNPGRWDEALTALCPGCGARFPAELRAPRVLDAIRGITRDARLGPGDSPCLSLPAAMWDEPRLRDECPACGKPLRFNPFAVDNRDRSP